MHPKTPWKRLRGVAPHPPLPGYIADALSERVGETLRAADLGLLGAQRVDQTVPADDGLDANYDAAGAEAVLHELGSRGAADARRFTLLRGPSLTQHAHLWLVSGVANALPLADMAVGAPSRLEAFRAVVETLRRLDDARGRAVGAPLVST